MQDLEETDYRELVRVLREKVATRAPHWTNTNDSDPGVALLDLLAFLAESMLAQGSALPERGRLSAARLAKAAFNLAGENHPEEGCGPVRNRYFSGRLLTAQDFELEQDYIRGRLRRRNRELHGTGVVRGLQVSVQPKGGGPGEQIIVQPGFAIAPRGEEIELCSEVSVSLPETANQLFVLLTYTERLAHPVPASNTEQTEFTRVEEAFSLRVDATARENDIPLARLIRKTAGWKIEQAFSVPRVRRGGE